MKFNVRMKTWNMLEIETSSGVTELQQLTTFHFGTYFYLDMLISIYVHKCVYLSKEVKLKASSSCTCQDDLAVTREFAHTSLSARSVNRLRPVDLKSWEALESSIEPRTDYKSGVLLNSSMRCKSSYILNAYRNATVKFRITRSLITFTLWEYLMR